MNICLYLLYYGMIEPLLELAKLQLIFPDNMWEIIKQHLYLSHAILILSEQQALHKAKVESVCTLFSHRVTNQHIQGLLRL